MTVSTAITIIICAVTVEIITLIFEYVRAEKINLKYIENQDKEELIQMMKISFIRSDIEMIELEVPKIYTNMFYRIYFFVYTTDDIIDDNRFRIQSNFHLSYENLGIENERIKYCCTISDYENRKIGLIERIKNKYKIVRRIW